MTSVEAEIIDLYTSGKTYDDIAATLRTGRHRIARAIRIYNQTGRIPLPLVLGPPRKVTQAIMSFIELLTIQRPQISGEQLSAEISGQFHVTLDASSINRTRSRLRFTYRPPRHIQALTVRHKEDRVAFCQDMIRYPEETLRKIYFSDESRIVLGTDKEWIWYRKGEGNDEANVASQKFPPSLMIFAVVGQGYKSKLLFVEGSINTHRYIENLEQIGFINDLDAIHGVLQWIFQQDGAPCHTSEEAIEWIEGNCDMIGNWPANSPDLSPIELLWAVLKRALRRYHPETIAELEESLRSAWDKIGQDIIDRLCDTFPARLRCCIEKNGESISRELFRLGEGQIFQGTNPDPRTHTAWTDEEDSFMLRHFHERGARWADMATQMDTGRTKVQVKSHWYSVLRHRLAQIRAAGFGLYRRIMENGWRNSASWSEIE
jgi:transposase